MPLRDAFANPRADAYKAIQLENYEKSKKWIDETPQTTLYWVQYRDIKKTFDIATKELSRINEIDGFFERSLLFEAYGDIEKYLLPEEQKWYVEALKELRDLRITSPQTSIGSFILYVKNIFLKHE